MRSQTWAASFRIEDPSWNLQLSFPFIIKLDLGYQFNVEIRDT